jgi:hypothetical protein
MDGLFVAGLGLIAFLLGVLERLPLERLNPRIRKATERASCGGERSPAMCSWRLAVS